jgi:hypothetical protein
MAMAPRPNSANVFQPREKGPAEYAGDADIDSDLHIAICIK